jgi:hypothetical protein
MHSIKKQFIAFTFLALVSSMQICSSTKTNKESGEKLNRSMSLSGIERLIPLELLIIQENETSPVEFKCNESEILKNARIQALTKISNSDKFKNNKNGIINVSAKVMISLSPTNTLKHTVSEEDISFNNFDNK